MLLWFPSIQYLSVILGAGEYLHTHTLSLYTLLFDLLRDGQCKTPGYVRPKFSHLFSALICSVALVQQYRPAHTENMLKMCFLFMFLIVLTRLWKRPR